jgi:hypothetical protein
MDRMALGQTYRGQSGTGTDLYKTKWHRDRFIVDRVALFIEDKVALGHIYRGQNGTGTYL